MKRAAIAFAAAQLRLDHALVVITVPVALIATWDAHLIRHHDTSVSRVLNAFAEVHPVQFWSYLLGGSVALGLHCTVTKDDILHKLGRRIRKAP